jgi:hypothetical protein
MTAASVATSTFSRRSKSCPDLAIAAIRSTRCLRYRAVEGPAFSRAPNVFSYNIYETTRKMRPKPSLTLTKRIAATRTERIVNRSLPPGAPVRQDQVAEEFGSSHVPIREAFRLLECGRIISCSAAQGRSSSIDRSRISRRNLVDASGVATDGSENHGGLAARSWALLEIEPLQRGAHGSEKTRDDHPGLGLGQGVALAERGHQQLLLCRGAPHECWHNPGKQNQERRPTGKCERLAQSDHGKSEINGVADKAIGTGRDEAGGPVCDGDEAPCRSKFPPRP